MLPQLLEAASRAPPCRQLVAYRLATPYLTWTQATQLGAFTIITTRLRPARAVCTFGSVHIAVASTQACGTATTAIKIPEGSMARSVEVLLGRNSSADDGLYASRNRRKSTRRGSCRDWRGKMQPGREVEGSDLRSRIDREASRSASSRREQLSHVSKTCLSSSACGVSIAAQRRRCDGHQSIFSSLFPYTW